TTRRRHFQRATVVGDLRSANRSDWSPSNPATQRLATHRGASHRVPGAPHDRGRRDREVVATQDWRSMPGTTTMSGCLQATTAARGHSLTRPLACLINRYDIQCSNVYHHHRRTLCKSQNGVTAWPCACPQPSSKPYRSRRETKSRFRSPVHARSKSRNALEHASCWRG